MKQISGIILIWLAFSCTAPKSQPGKTYSKDIECVSADGDGSQNIRVWCGGKVNGSSCEQAFVRGVKQILFEGIVYGNKECNASPLVLDPNVQFKQEKYFFKFFEKDGTFMKYINNGDPVKNKIKCQDAPHPIVFKVSRLGLEHELEGDGIIKK